MLRVAFFFFGWEIVSLWASKAALATQFFYTITLNNT